MHGGTVVEQRQEHGHTLDDGRAQASVEATSSVQIPALDGLELVIPRGPPGALRLSDLIHHLAPGQKGLDTGLVRMRRLVGVLGEPVRPRFLDAMRAEVGPRMTNASGGSGRSAFRRRMSLPICPSSMMQR
jgi:hypothetical protein